MNEKFEIILLEEVWELLDKLEEKVKDKILYNIEKARQIMKKYFEQKKTNNYERF